VAQLTEREPTAHARRNGKLARLGVTAVAVAAHGRPRSGQSMTQIEKAD
jgi:hypothetical protein